MNAEKTERLDGGYQPDQSVTHTGMPTRGPKERPATERFYLC